MYVKYYLQASYSIKVKYNILVVQTNYQLFFMTYNYTSTNMTSATGKGVKFGCCTGT